MVFLHTGCQAQDLGPDKGLLRCIIDSGSDLIYVKDVNGIYLGCNKKAEEVIGLSEAEQIGKTDFHFFSREVAQKIRAQDLKILATGKDLTGFAI